MSEEEYQRIRVALRAARSLRKSFPHGRLRVTPEIHEKLAAAVCAGTDMEPLGIIVASLEGIRVELDADIPDPGWQLDTWRDNPDAV